MKDKDALKSALCQGINVLLVFAPVGILSTHLEWSSLAVFCTNFLGVIPLAGLLGFATESLSEHTGEMIGGLINASFGNAVEMIVSVDAIKRGLVSVVQASLVGSVLSNLLLVLGMAFFAAGLKRKEDAFMEQAANANSSMLLVAAIGVTLPTLFSSTLEKGSDESTTKVLAVSRICSIILGCVYFLFLLFQLKTHRHHFSTVDTVENGSLEAEPSKNNPAKLEAEREEEEEENIFLSPYSSVALLVFSTYLISELSERLVGSIENVSEEYGMPKSFIGLVLLPIVGNAAEHMTAVVSAMKGKMDLAIGVAVGSSTQVALLIVPFSVVVGWAYRQPMTLDFGTFGCGILLSSVFLVSHVVQDGQANWLEGLMLVACYTMISVICWYMPNASDSDS